MKIHTHHITPACSQLFIENDKRWYPLKIHNATIHKKIILLFFGIQVLEMLGISRALHR